MGTVVHHRSVESGGSALTAWYASCGKRILDLMVCVPCTILSLPILATIAVLAKVFMGSPVMYWSNRPGLGGKPFSLLKFRTMKDSPDEEGQLLPDGQRLTRFGRFLRLLSLDELPEVLNVLRGEMSLVGPRPLLMEYLERYTVEQARRHEVKPGITGWAQVNGRNSLSWEEKFEYDVWYVDHVSLWLDLKILAMTICRVTACRGISAEGHATMPEFNGSSTSGQQREDSR